MTDLHNIDKLDRAILRRLQENGRQTYDVIGEQVGLSPSAVLRRVKRLEDVGIIERYVALIAPANSASSQQAAKTRAFTARWVKLKCLKSAQTAA